MNKITTYLSEFLEKISNFVDGRVSGIKLGDFRWEWWIAVFIIFIIFISGFSYGRSKLFISLISLYIASIIEPLFVYFDNIAPLLSSVEPYLVHIILFFFIYFIVFVLLNRSSLKARFSLKEFTMGPIFLLAILKFGFLASVVLAYIPADAIPDIASLSQYFTTDTMKFWWAVLPILGTLFLKKSNVDK